MESSSLSGSATDMFIVIAFLFYVAAAFLIFKGSDKYLNYVNEDPEEMGLYAADSVNAYVGGDAYNYIINGTYMTGFFTLAAGLIVAGTVFVLLHFFLKKNLVQADTKLIHQDNLNEQGGN